MNICKKCGTELDSNVKFCPVCGERYIEDQTANNSGNYQQPYNNQPENAFPQTVAFDSDTAQPEYPQAPVESYNNQPENTFSQTVAFGSDTAQPEVPVAPVTSKKKRKLSKKHIIIIGASVVLAALICVVGLFVVKPSLDYKKANKLADQGKYSEAAEIYKDLGDYKDSEDKIKYCNYEMANDLVKKAKYSQAAKIYKELGNYKDSKDKVKLCSYEEALDLVEDGKYDKARDIFESLDDYKDSKDKLSLCSYEEANMLMEDGQYEEAASIYKEIGDYSDASSKFVECNRRRLYEYVENCGDDAMFRTTVSDVSFMIGCLDEDDSLMFAFQDEGELNIIFGIGVEMSGDTGVFLLNSDGDEVCGGSVDISEISSSYVSGDDYTITKILNDDWSLLSTAESVSESSFKILSGGMETLLEETGLGITAEDLGFLSI